MHQAMQQSSMRDKIQKLLDQIRRDFPNGCEDLDCSDCPLELHEPATLDEKVCTMLEWQFEHRYD